MAKSTKVKAPTATHAEKIIEKLNPTEPITEVVADDTVVKIAVPDAKAFSEITPTPIVIIPQVAEEKTEEQRIVDYINNAHSEKVDLAPILKSFYPLPTFASRPKYLQQGESKRLKGLLTKMVSDGLIQLADDQYKKLGKFYYVDKQTETMYWNIDTLRIFAKK